MYFVGQGGFRSAIAAGAMGQIELLSDRKHQALPRSSQTQAPAQPPAGSGATPAAASSAPVPAPATEEAPPSAPTPGVAPAAGATRAPALPIDPKTDGRTESPYSAGSELPSMADSRSDGAHLGDGRGRDELYGAVYRDRLSKQMAMVREHFALSARETEVAELIARGNSVARIAEMLVVSENTVRTHSKRIYTKLGIHKRQELIELVAEFDPRAH